MTLYHFQFCQHAPNTSLMTMTSLDVEVGEGVGSETKSMRRATPQ